MDSLPTRVAQVAGRAPQRVALVDGDRRLDYAGFWRQAQHFAAHLRAQGVRVGDRVALILPNRLEAAVAIYGGWLAGAVIVPLNVQARSRDFIPWLRHSGACHVVFEAGHRDVHEALAELADDPGTTELGEAQGLPGEDNSATDFVAPLPDAPAMILYTSGTTGDPKGVMLSHANLLANAESVVAYLQLQAEDSVLSVLPFYYAYGASVLHTHLLTGACVVLGPSLMFPLLVLEAIEREQATGFSGVPSTYALLLEPMAERAASLGSLRYLTQAGGAMSPALTQRLRGVLPAPRLYVMYGQTEATSRISWLPPERLGEKLGSVGIPVAGVQWKIVGDDGGELPRGESGEVCVRGANVMPGYWNNPEASAKVLRDGWLHTGDLGYLDTDGYLYLQGRRSDMIKTGAHRVHPTDVEEVIAEMPGIREVAVVGVDDEVMGQVIKAYIVSDGERPPRAEDRIKAHCRARLAPYKIPRLIAFVDALPRTASGKVRRVQLMEQTATP
ncbi:class I adenylate-forming enzyme family protein [Pseudoxanthomonas indica]|uniref:Acyl-CoA synthetase (AMP-forming)/AMP-acid ligase II n=1 Tax=Pseudoxanthomonas indica TaxID=428993 RepID=A0A1T5J2U4_9GAMM|nr:class I adenylate-forming enzyme family protein [Pseudoxanthomonas indica]GGD55953.1 AMP-dependent ligase [Pseudoxanthomonas indica]SKC45696.1 Acyl-CoA synthetase (AMP-forming)/AMP-acid ligase II [Pseudoxanthomonas indica]